MISMTIWRAAQTWMISHKLPAALAAGILLGSRGCGSGDQEATASASPAERAIVREERLEGFSYTKNLGV